MPYLDFDIYMFTRVVEIETLPDIVEAVVEAHKAGLSQVKEITMQRGEDYMLLMNITLYGDVEWEIRIWATQNDIIMITNIDEGYDENTLRKAVIEVFAVKRRKMMQILDTLGAAGYQPQVTTRDMLSSQLSRILKIQHEPRKEEQNQTTTENTGNITQEIQVTVPQRDGKPEQGPAAVVSGLWKTIGECLVQAHGIQPGATGVDNLLGDKGIVILAKGDSFICAMRTGGECQWMLIELTHDKSSTKCYNDRGKLLEALDEALNKGYRDITGEIAGLLNGSSYSPL